jgi:hypothetical protein
MEDIIIYLKQDQVAARIPPNDLRCLRLSIRKDDLDIRVILDNMVGGNQQVGIDGNSTGWQPAAGIYHNGPRSGNTDCFGHRIG